MKWLKRKTGPSMPLNSVFEGIVLQNKDGDPKLIGELYKQGYDVWVTYPDDDPCSKPFKVTKTGQRKYEIFVGGFLYYHDNVYKKVEKKIIFDHDIYFEWFGIGRSKKVRIYITKTPKWANTNPPKPPAPPPPEP